MIASRYHELLDHLERTVTLSTLERNENVVGIGLRHDVDHDLGVALDMAKVEYERSMPATYFLLHTAEYCRDPLFLARCQQLVAYGHEIGLHLDALGGWYRGEFDDVHAELASWLERVRGVGIEVRLSSAHGARVCYDGGFINNWIWRELRGDNPQSTEDGLSAEGIAVEDPAYCVAYPAQEEVVRPDGTRMALWQVSMRDLGIEAEACRIPVDRYWSDSGGTWKRSPDPALHDLSSDRNQVLVHPWWWREPRRDILVLGTAQSGMKWLSERFDAGTSATTLHGLTLNQDGRSLEPVAGPERTADDFVGLLEDVDRVRNLVADAFVARHRARRDTIETNEHLPHVDPDLLRRDGVTFVHLHRDPTEVVRSILDRGWYDTPDDRRHPRFEVAGWDSMDRFAQACTYWAESNRQLLQAYPDAIRVAVEDLQADPAALFGLFDRLGLATHQVPLAHAEAAEDRAEAWSVPPVVEWDDDDRRVFIDVCGPIVSLLGRHLELEEPWSTDSDEASQRDAAVARSHRLDLGTIASHRVRFERRRLFKPRDYECLLADFAEYETFTMAEYVQLPEVGDRRVLLIRHDVDHDLETAVRIAEWEAARGIRSTWCLLHTAWYWGEFDGRRYRRTRNLIEAGDRILELGHEINLHNNFATLALETGCDPGRVLESELEFMRSMGWPVTGTSTHGDSLCRELGFRNFELFEHAVKEDFGGARTVWKDNGGVRLGSLRQEDFGLEYEAYDIQRDIYVSDSGGRPKCLKPAPGRRWFGRSDPSRGSVVGILTHPIWWNFPR